MEVENNKFQGGKIYIIRSHQTEKYYIGSTIQKCLSIRFNAHNRGYKYYLKTNYGKVSSFEIIKLGDAYIELLEAYPCNNKLELHKREGELIREHTANCVNKNIAGNTTYKQYTKQYYKTNIDKIKENQYKYRMSNKTLRKEYAKQYYKAKKEHYSQYAKQYYKAKKEQKELDILEAQYLAI